MDYSNRPPRGKQATPTKAEIADAWSRIREAAAAGDLYACALLIALSDKQRPLMHTDGGIYNLPGKSSGWRGDENDPREAILAKIREEDPQSKQLPENQ